MSVCTTSQHHDTVPSQKVEHTNALPLQAIVRLVANESSYRRRRPEQHEADGIAKWYYMMHLATWYVEVALHSYVQCPGAKQFWQITSFIQSVKTSVVTSNTDSDLLQTLLCKCYDTTSRVPSYS
eukprot:5160056-Amphidinium_carterae.1